MLKKSHNLKINVNLPVIYKYKNMDNKKFPTNNSNYFGNSAVIMHRESIEKRENLTTNNYSFYTSYLGLLNKK